MAIAEINDTKIYYDVQGSGEPVVLIPGLGLDHSYYAYAIPHLKKFCRVISFDPRGIGKSAKPDVTYSMALWAEDVVALLDHIGEPSAHVVGSSLGGCVAMELIKANPEKVRSLVLVAAFARLDRSLAANFQMRIALAETPGMEEALRSHVMLWTLGRHFIETERGQEVVDNLKNTLAKNTPSLYANFLRALLDFGGIGDETFSENNRQEELKKIQAPTLLTVGADDILTPPFFSEEIATLVPGATMQIIEDCGHITFLEKPRENSEIIAAFLKSQIQR